MRFVVYDFIPYVSILFEDYVDEHLNNVEEHFIYVKAYVPRMLNFVVG